MGRSGEQAHRLGVVEAAAALASGDLEPETLVADCLEQISALNEGVNAFVWIDPETAMGEAERSAARWRDGAPLSPFDGIPIGVKDNIDVVGMPTSNGVCACAPAVADAACVRPWREAGFVMLGKLNMHECALGTTTENPHFGATRNPVNDAFSAGGSSGGSGAAVAAEMCPLSLGTDTMGSVRLPASSCGVHGWKPGRGTFGLDGMHVLHPDLDTAGPLVRDTEDLLAIMNWTTGHEAASNPVRFLSVSELDLTPMHPDVQAQWTKVRERLQPQAVSLEGFVPSAMRRSALLEIEAKLAAEFTPADRNGLSPVLESMIAFGATVTADRAREAAGKRATLADRALALFGDDVVMVSPSSPIPPTRLGDEPVAYHADYLLLANVCGATAVSVPCGWSADGLPLGLHLMAGPGREDLLMAAVQQVRERGLLNATGSA